MVVAAFVLGVAGASQPMFGSSLARATLSRDVEEGCRYLVGLRVERVAALVGTTEAMSQAATVLDDATPALDEGVGDVPGIDRPVLTLTGDGDVSSGDRTTAAQLMARTGARDHIELLDEGPGEGALISDDLAETLEVGVGDEIEFAAEPEAARVPILVTGIYRDLRAARDRSWCSLRFHFEARGAGGGAPPPVMLFEADVLRNVLVDAGTPTALATWEYAPDPAEWDLGTAQSAIRSLERTNRAVSNQSDPLGNLVGYGSSSVDQPGSVAKAENMAALVETLVGPVALGTIGVAVVMLLAAARSWLARRAQEVTILTLRGAGPVTLGIQGVAELLPALLVGAAAGIGAAAAIVREVGPDPRIERSAVDEGLFVVALAVVVAMVAVVVVVAAGVRRVGVGIGGARAGRALPPWEPVVLALAGAAFYELRLRDSAIDDGRVDGLLLLFPLLLLAGGAGLAGRLALMPRPANWLARRSPSAVWLALRRLVAARMRAALIVTGIAVSIGVVVFAGALSASVRATSYAKATLGPGAAQVVRLSITSDRPDEPPLPGISTMVTRTAEKGVEVRGHPRSDVLGVDPATFADAAYWDETFADRPLEDLVGLLERGRGGGVAPAIGVGPGLPDELLLTLPDSELLVRIVARADAFPGLGSEVNRPLVVVDRAILNRLGVVEHTEVWVDDASAGVRAQLEDQGLGVVFTARPGADTEGTPLEAFAWAIDYLEIVGLAAGLVTLAGLGLYIAADSRRRRLGSAVARRLGMRPRQGAVATACEIAAILFAGLALGVGLAWFAARLVFRNLDPQPNSPPAALFEVDLGIIAGCGLAVLTTALVTTGFIEWRASRSALAEVLRDVG